MNSFDDMLFGLCIVMTFSVLALLIAASLGEHIDVREIYIYF